MLQLLMLLMAVAMLRVPAYDGDEFLSPEQTFRFSATQVDGQTVEVKFGIVDGYYMYRERLAVAADPATVTFAPLRLPAGKIKHDENFGKEAETYRHELVFRVRAQSTSASFTLTITSQGCADQRLRYPPMKSRFQVRPSSALVMPATPAATAAGSIEPEGKQGRITSTFGSGNLGAVAALFFGLGLLLTFTPCVLPMLPIVLAIVAGEYTTCMRAAFVSVGYILDMVIVYTALGVAAGLAGQGLQATLQSAWVLGAFALLIALLSSSMPGLYELQLPVVWHHHLMQASNRLSGGQVVDAAVMGAPSALIVSLCVTAPLAGALAYTSQTDNAAVGGAALFALSMGMGVPLILVGVDAGNLPSRSGHWLVVTKTVFGFILLAVAWYIVRPVLPSWVAMAGRGALLTGAAVSLRTFDSLPDGAGNVQRLGKVIGVMLALAGATQLVGVAAGGRDPLQPLMGVLRASTVASTFTLTFKRVKSATESGAEVHNANAAGKPVMLDLYADWCVSCKEVGRLTFTDVRVRKALVDVVLLQVDVTANNADDQALLKRFGLFGPSDTVLFDTQGCEVQARVIGFERADTFLTSLHRALGAGDAAQPAKAST